VQHPCGCGKISSVRSLHVQMHAEGTLLATQAATPGDPGWGAPAGGGGGAGTWNAPTPSYTPAYTPADTPAAMASTPGLTDPGACAHLHPA
jgi:hypothetical protein